ncbi:MAG: N-acetyltransferase family protein [Bianqueaceae bacterium]
MDKSKISIRIATIQDAEALLAIYAPYVENTAITFEYTVPSVEEFARRIHRVMTRYPYLIAEAEGEILGYAYASAFHSRAAYDWAVEVWYVNRHKRRMGIGGTLYKALEMSLSAQNILNLNACIAYPRKKMNI